MSTFKAHSRDRQRCSRCGEQLAAHRDGRCPGALEDPAQIKRHTDPRTGERLSNRDYFARVVERGAAVCASGHESCADWQRGPCAPAVALLIDLEDSGFPPY